jgi:transposase
VTREGTAHSRPRPAWLKRHPRFVLHFTPTYSSWLNQVESWFSNLTEQALRRSRHPSTKELEEAIGLYLEASNEALRLDEDGRPNPG